MEVNGAPHSHTPIIARFICCEGVGLVVVAVVSTIRGETRATGVFGDRTSLHSGGLFRGLLGGYNNTRLTARVEVIIRGLMW